MYGVAMYMMGFFRLSAVSKWSADLKDLKRERVDAAISVTHLIEMDVPRPCLLTAVYFYETAI
jgi:hypothetical protein